MATYANVIGGLSIFASKVMPGVHINGADHDVIFGASLTTILTPEDREKLDAMGWRESQEYDCWCIGV